MKILIDNGHGRATAGKRSPVWPDGKQLFEYEFNRDIARRVHEALTARGADSVPVVPEIDDIPLAERTRRVNEIAAQVGPENCLLVSIHANAGGGTGWEAWNALVVGRLLDLLRNLLVEQIDVQHTDKGIFTHSARVDLRIQLLHILTVLRNLGFVLRQSL